MKQLHILISILIGIFICGCDSENMPSLPISNIGNIHSRNMNSQTVLVKGSNALFNASGGLAFTNEVFIFTGSQWENTNVSLSPDNSITTNLTALYPAYNNEQDNILITSNPYSNNALTDVLVAKSTFTSETDINLEFKHLFAKLTIHVASSLADKINQIEVIAPKVTSINGIDGSFTVSTNETHSTLLSKDESGAYSYILPTIENCNLIIIINPGENEIRHPLTHNFESGKKYECTITQTDTRPGIRTAEDLIDFSLLVNNPNSLTLTGKTLSDFGETVNGRIIYRLLADIDFSEIQSNNMLPIGYYEAKAFQHIFDGEGHTIYNLILPNKSTNSNIVADFSGLFGCIGEEGIVKNLHLNQVSTTANTTSTRLGGIAAQNKGLILNCSVENSMFHEIEKVGGICGSLSPTGYIVNCYTSYNNFHLANGYKSGGIAGDGNGNIINCYAYANRYNTVSGSYSGGIAGESSSGNIHNCYVHQNNIPSYWGTLLGIYNSSVKMRHFFYNGGKYIVYNPKQETSSNAKIYDTNFEVDGTHISNLLNDWITTTGQTEYPNLTFRTWKVAENGSACFQ